MWDFLLMSHTYMVTNGHHRFDNIGSVIGFGLGFITFVWAMITPEQFTQWCLAITGGVTMIGIALIQLRREWTKPRHRPRRKPPQDREL